MNKPHLILLAALLICTVRFAPTTVAAPKENRIVAIDAVPASPILDGKPGVEFFLIANKPFGVGAMEWELVIAKKLIRLPWYTNDQKGVFFAMPRAEFDKLPDGADVTVIYGYNPYVPAQPGYIRNFGKLRKTLLLNRKQSLLAVKKNSPEEGGIYAQLRATAEILEKRAQEANR